MKKDKRKIPLGYYCYTYTKDKRIICPYWSIRKNKPNQENGYCSYLEKGDWNINTEKIWLKNTDGTDKSQSANEIGLPLSLLWDQCKMCGINE